jgi:ABC-2 type transport system ATP-binding protein
VAVVMEKGFIPVLENCKLISSNNGSFEYDVDLSNTSVRDLLNKLSTIGGIKDVEIKKAPIEQVIEGLYTKWKA